MLVDLRGGLLFSLKLQSKASAAFEECVELGVHMDEGLLHEWKEQTTGRAGPRNQQRTGMLSKQDKLTTAIAVH